MADKQQILSIDDADQDKYDYLATTRMFKGQDTKELFLTAMAVGFYNETRIPLNKKKGYTRTSYLKDNDQALIEAIILSSEGVNALLDYGLIYKIAEEYAHGGIAILDEIVQRPGSFEKNYEKLIIECLEK